VREKFIKDYGYEPTSQELFEIFNEMGMGIKHKEDLVNVTVVSMDTPPVAKPNGIDDDDEVTIEYGEDNTIMEDLDKDMNITKIRAIMKYLDDNETKVIRSKFGFDNGVEKDELGVAHDLGITVYTATKLLESAFNKLKKYKFLFE
jgi:DNA-directed RNA polymerase sigma subunit (sigma70/sigma32)